MSNNIFEELPSRKGGEAKPGADAAAGIEKKARQLVYDSRYEVKKMLAGKRADPASQERMVLGRIAKSTAIPAVKARARQMVSKKAAVAEDFIPMMEDAAATNIANAMFKVFVEGVEEIVPDYLEELHGLDDKKYKIRVTDPKTGNSYVRYGTREKITQLRSKGLKVELTEYGEPREGEKKRGEETARATGGGGRPGRKKLDPVGREDADPDNDGIRNDPNDKYIMKRRAAIGAAIEKRKTVSSSYEMDGQMIDESEIGDRARRVVRDQRQGVHGDADDIKQNMDAINLNLLKMRPYGVKGFPSAKKDTKKTTQVAHFEPEGKLVESKKSKKHKKTSEPRWQDSDGDGKWYEPEDVKKEDYLWTEGTDSTEGKNTRKITGTGVDNYSSGVVKISPEDGTQVQTGPKSVYAHTELEGELISEKAMSKAQQRFMGMVYARKKGKMKKGEASPEVEAAAKGMTKKEAKKFAKTKHKGLPEKIEESGYFPTKESQRADEKKYALSRDGMPGQVKPRTAKNQTKVNEEQCSPEDEKKKDTRGDYAKINLIKNKLRAMGAKNPIVMVANENVEKGPILPGEKGKRIYPKGQEPKATGAKLPPLQNAGFEPTGNVISEREFDEPGEEDWRPDVRAHNKAVGYRGGYNKYRGTRKPKPENPGPGSQAKPAD
jgi:hypothetical protein